VLALDTDEQKVQNASGKATHTVQADATDEAVLKELGAGDFDIAVIAIGTSVQNSVLATILLKKLGVPYVIARASSALHGEILNRIGADRVVYPERQMGEKVAHEATLGAVTDYMKVVTGYGIIRVEAKADFVGQTLSELGIGPKGKLGIATLLIQRGKDVIISPDIRETVKKDDILIVSGNDEKLTDFFFMEKRDTGEKEQKA
jgi:trk system potassium uptake protein